MVADLSLDKEMLQDALRRKLRSHRKRKLVDEVRGEWDVSIRRTCRVFLVGTSTYHYKFSSPRTGCPRTTDHRRAGR